MRILFLTARFPLPAVRGDQVRAWGQLRELARRHRVSLICPATTGELSQHGGELADVGLSVHAVPLDRGRYVTTFLKAPATRLPLQTVLFCSQSLLSAVAERLHEEKSDLVHVQLARLGPVLPYLRTSTCVMDLVDALSVNMARRARLESFPRRWFFNMEAQRLRTYEQSLVQQAHRSTIISDADREAIGSPPRLHVVPNGVDMFERRRTRFASEHRLVVVFSGRMGYFPNEDAARWFIAEVHLRLRAQIPDATCYIVGADPPRSLQKMSSVPGVTVTGFVKSVRDYLEKATIAVAPMRSGSGMQNKILEAMAAGVPVVASPLAVAGLSARHGEHLLVAGSADEFVSAVLGLYRDSDLRRQIASQATRWLETNFHWSKVVGELERVYELALNTATAREP